jgi:hypothetical protein
MHAVWSLEGWDQRKYLFAMNRTSGESREQKQFASDCRGEAVEVEAVNLSYSAHTSAYSTGHLSKKSCMTDMFFHCRLRSALWDLIIKHQVIRSSDCSRWPLCSCDAIISQLREFLYPKYPSISFTLIGSLE